MSKAGPAEELISASVSHKVYNLLMREGNVTGSLIGASAVVSGALDGLAHYLADVQLTDDTPQEIAEAIVPHFATFLTHRRNAAQGNA